MFRSVQSWIGTACVLLVVSIGGSVVAVGGPSVVETLIDRPGISEYCDTAAIDFADATESIELVLSTAEIDENPLWEQLLNAHARGVRVRVILDESDWAPSITQRNRPFLEGLARNGIEARTDDPAVTTHAKLAIVDRSVVIVGSTNWNRYAFTDQEQANVRIVDDRVGAAFGAWFDHLWAGGQAIVPQVDIDETWARKGPRIVPLPDSGGAGSYAAFVLATLARAHASVHVVLYRMSIYPDYSGSASNRLIDGLIRAAARGLDVRVLLDDCSFYPESADANLMSALYLFEHGVPVRFDRPEETTHAKLLVVDGEHVVLGSTNWNYYALEQNVEANVALLGMPEVADVFDGFFDRLWESGRAIGRDR